MYNERDALPELHARLTGETALTEAQIQAIAANIDGDALRAEREAAAMRREVELMRDGEQLGEEGGAL